MKNRQSSQKRFILIFLYLQSEQLNFLGLLETPAHISWIQHLQDKHCIISFSGSSSHILQYHLEETFVFLFVSLHSFFFPAIFFSCFLFAVSSLFFFFNFSNFVFFFLFFLGKILLPFHGSCHGRHLFFIFFSLRIRTCGRCGRPI